MKARLIEIDTNGSNSGRFTNNLELYDLITPKIMFLVDGSDIYIGNQIDWEQTRKGFDGLHCIWLKDGSGYISAADFTQMGVVVDDESEYVTTLSELCDDLAETHNITSWFEGKSKNFLIEDLQNKRDRLQEKIKWWGHALYSVETSIANYYKK